MKESLTLKAVLNRQYIALGTRMPLERGLFECKGAGRIGTLTPSVTFKPFERVYPLKKDATLKPIEN